MKHYKYILLLLLSFALFSCGNDQAVDVTIKKLLKQDFSQLPTAKLQRVFKLTKLDQAENLQFFADQEQLTQQMIGEAYNWQQSLQLVHFDQRQGRLILKGDKKNKYLLWFIKNAPENGSYIYRYPKYVRLSAALEKEPPADDDLGNKGWLRFYEHNPKYDELDLQATLLGKRDKLVFADGYIIFKDTKFEFLSYHHADRRWVGTDGDAFLLLFIKHVAADEYAISFAVHRYLDKVYQVDPKLIPPTYWQLYKVAKNEEEAKQ